MDGINHIGLYLTSIERPCCGTFIGSRHRATCQKSAAMKRIKFNSDKAKARRQLETLRNHAVRDAYEQTDATAHLTDVDELK